MAKKTKRVGRKQARTTKPTTCGQTWNGYGGRKGGCTLPAFHAGVHVDARGQSWGRHNDPKPAPVVPVVKGPQLELVADRARNTRSQSAAEFFGAQNVGTERPIGQHPALLGYSTSTVNGGIRAEGRILPVVSMRLDAKLLDQLDELAKRDPHRPTRSMLITSAIKAFIAGGAENVPCAVCGAGKRRAA